MVVLLALALLAAGIVACGEDAPRPTDFRAVCAPKADEDDAEGVRFDATFEDGGVFPPYDGEYVNDDGPGVDSGKGTVDSPVRTGDRAMRLVMPPSGGSVNRSQLQTPNDLLFRSGDDYWYGISLYLGEDWKLDRDQLDDNREAFAGVFSFRWEAISDEANGPSGGITMVRIGDEPHFVSRRETRGWDFPDDAGNDTIDLGPIVTGRWIDFVMHIRWSDSPDDALREFWRDGRFMGRSTNQNMGTDSPIINRVGVYQGTGVDHTRTLYWDNHRIAGSCAEVDPASP